MRECWIWRYEDRLSPTLLRNAVDDCHLRVRFEKNSNLFPEKRSNKYVKKCQVSSRNSYRRFRTFQYRKDFDCALFCRNGQQWRLTYLRSISQVDAFRIFVGGLQRNWLLSTVSKPKLIVSREASYIKLNAKSFSWWYLKIPFLERQGYLVGRRSIHFREVSLERCVSYNGATATLRNGVFLRTRIQRVRAGQWERPPLFRAFISCDTLQLGAMSLPRLAEKTSCVRGGDDDVARKKCTAAMVTRGEREKREIKLSGRGAFATSSEVRNYARRIRTLVRGRDERVAFRWNDPRAHVDVYKTLWCISSPVHQQRKQSLFSMVRETDSALHTLSCATFSACQSARRISSFDCEGRGDRTNAFTVTVIKLFLSQSTTDRWNCRKQFLAK